MDNLSIYICMCVQKYSMWVSIRIYPIYFLQGTLIPKQYFHKIYYISLCMRPRVAGAIVMGMRESREKYLKYKLFISFHGLLLLIPDFTNILPSLHSKNHCGDVWLGDGLLGAQENVFPSQTKAHAWIHLY